LKKKKDVAVSICEYVWNKKKSNAKTMWNVKCECQWKGAYVARTAKCTTMVSDNGSIATFNAGILRHLLSGLFLFLTMGYLSRASGQLSGIGAFLKIFFLCLHFVFNLYLHILLLLTLLTFNFTYFTQYFYFSYNNTHGCLPYLISERHLQKPSIKQNVYQSK